MASLTVSTFSEEPISTLYKAMDWRRGTSVLELYLNFYKQLLGSSFDPHLRQSFHEQYLINYPSIDEHVSEFYASCFE